MKNLSLTKKLLIALGILIVAWVASSYIIGQMMQSKIQQKVDSINAVSSQIKLEVTTLSSGIFTSELAVNIKPSENEEAPKTPLKIQVEHGPLLGIFSNAGLQLGLGYAYVTAEDFANIASQGDDAVKKMIPVNVELSLLRGIFSGSEIFNMNIANKTDQAIDIPGGKLEFSSLTLTGALQGEQAQLDIVLPVFKAEGLIPFMGAFKFDLENLNLKTIALFSDLPKDLQNKSVSEVIALLKTIDIDYKLGNMEVGMATGLGEPVTTIFQLKNALSAGQIAFEMKDGVRLVHSTEAISSIEKIMAKTPAGETLIDAKYESKGETKNMYLDIVQDGFNFAEWENLINDPSHDPVAKMLEDYKKSIQYGASYDQTVTITSNNGNGAANLKFLLQANAVQASEYESLDNPDEILKKIVQNADIKLSVDQKLLQHNLNHLTPVIIGLEMPSVTRNELTPEQTQEQVNSFIEQTLKAFPIIKQSENTLSVQVTFNAKDGLKVNDQGTSIIGARMNPTQFVNPMALPDPQAFLKIFIEDPMADFDGDGDELEESQDTEAPTAPEFPMPAQ